MIVWASSSANRIKAGVHLKNQKWLSDLVLKMISEEVKIVLWVFLEGLFS